MKFSKLKQKTVINMCDGRSLGYICDLVIEVPCGRVSSIIVPGCQSIKNIFSPRNYVIPWNCIVKIGDDVILVNIDLNCCSIEH